MRKVKVNTAVVTKKYPNKFIKDTPEKNPFENLITLCLFRY